MSQFLAETKIVFIAAAKNVSLLPILRGGSRKLFWEGHIGLESPKGERSEAGYYPFLSRLGGLGSVEGVQ